MLDLFRKRNRLEDHYYSKKGHYFLTFRLNSAYIDFGKIIDNKMSLNYFGKFVTEKWKEIPSHYDNKVRLDAWVVMPNHIHGIIEILKTELKEDEFRCGLISKIIGAFKAICSKELHKKGYFDFSWQRSFYDGILEKESALFAIRTYIKNNPVNWKNDKYYKR